MPVYTFEDILNGAIDRISPGATVLMSAFHKGPDGGVAASKGIIKESLYHKSGRFKITCGITKCGDDHVCTK